MLKKFFIFLLLPAVSLVLTGCFNLASYDQKILDTNQQISDQAREKVDEGIEVGKEKLKEYTREQIQQIAQGLTTNMKESIDAWIAENNLNQYGDPSDTMYAGGTPLFDESTGESKDRYEYILDKNPELIDQLDLKN